MSDFRIGDRIFHADHGLGMVGWVGPEYIGVAFDVFGKALIRRDGAALRPATPADICRPPPSSSEVTATDFSAAPPAPFFVMETSADEHFPGSHWEAFVDEPGDLLKFLPQVLPKATVARSYGNFYPPPVSAAAKWSTGHVLQITSATFTSMPGFERKPHPWDHISSWRVPGSAIESTPKHTMDMSESATGIAAIIKHAQSTGQPNTLCSLFPYCTHGIEHALTLQTVHLWENGLVAQLSAKINGTEITFFDTDFIHNRDWYQRDLKCQFILCGLAYEARPPTQLRFTIPRTESYFQAMQWLTGEDRRSASGALEESYDLSGMAALMSIEGGDRDDYSFRGPISEVGAMSILGQRAWRARVTVLRLAGREPEDMELDIVITERAWKADSPPQAGQAIEGSLWLQGRLWNIPQ